ncbi:MAG TPA: metalloregulator ArsR/SmtB family transcription factor [Clostridiales bacterium]|nr:metalloregulator ArsR/SmtB family transcription factor [Clostridiales bacterium]
MKNDKKKKAYMRNHEMLAPVFKAFSNPKRINLLLAIREEACRVGNMTECINESFPIVSQQLAILKRHGIVEREKKQNNEVYYTIVNDLALKILDLIEEFDRKKIKA